MSGSGVSSTNARGKQFLPILVTVTLDSQWLSFRNLQCPFKCIQRTSEAAVQNLMPSVYVPSNRATQAADVSEGAGVGVGGIHNDVTHRKYRGRLGTSQGWFLLHGLTSSSVKINRQSEYGTRVHNGIVDFHAQSKLIFQLSPMFICAIQLSINRVSFLGSINKCQVGKHFRSKQSLEMFLFILKHVRIFYNSRLQNVHVLCLGQSNNLLEKNLGAIAVISGTFLLRTVKDSATFWRRLIQALGFASVFFFFFHDWIGLQPEAFQIKS